MAVLTITSPPEGFTVSDDTLEITGTSTGFYAQITVQVTRPDDRTTYRVNVLGGSFSVTVPILRGTDPIPIQLDAFEGGNADSSIDHAVPVHGTIAGDPIPPGTKFFSVYVLNNQFSATVPITITNEEQPITVQAFSEDNSVESNEVTGTIDSIAPPDEWWSNEGYETLIQSEASLYNSDPEKTVRSFSLDFNHEEDPEPLLCYSQIGVGGLPACIDWWQSEPWPIKCQMHQGAANGNHRDSGPMMWPYFATGRYVAWRVYLSNRPTPEAPLTYQPLGGVIDFERTRIALSVGSECI